MAKRGDIVVQVEGTRAESKCKTCGRSVSWVDGKQSQHGPDPNGRFICRGDTEESRLMSEQSPKF